MLDIVQELIFSICNELPTELVSEQRKSELSKKIETRNFWDVLENYFGEDIRKLSSADLLKLAHAEGYQVKDFDDLDFELAKFGYDVIKRKISNNFTTPVFVNRFPACISPLAKEIADGSGEADRGYGFLRGQRLFEVVEEASNYNEQLEKFQSQDDRKPTDEYSFKHDDLLESLSYGCPPMAGLGFNINRVLAVLLDKNRTSDVVAFPITSSALPL